MAGRVSGVGLGVALAGSAMVPVALGLPLRRGGLLVLLIAVLMASRWRGRRAGLAATVASVAAGGVLLALNGSAPAAADTVTLGLLAVLGAGIAVWTVPATPARRPDGREDSRLKEEFLSTVSHELRTPLNAILGWTELLRAPRELPSHEVGHGLEVIERNARRQLALVEELLAAVEPSRTAAEWVRIDVRELMRGVVGSLEPTARAAAVAVHDDDAPAPAWPAVGPADPIWVRGDPAGLTVALRHIVGNAIKFTAAGGLVRTHLAHEGGVATIAVSDSGRGVDPALTRDVFEPFRQQDGSASRSHGGLGLGLAIARRLIEAHGGHVDLRSAGVGRGATCVVTLPLLASNTRALP